jgi:hypothetical protein
MATGQKISATTYHHGVLEGRESYNKLLPAKKGRKSDDPFHKA